MHSVQEYVKGFFCNICRENPVTFTDCREIPADVAEKLNHPVKPLQTFAVYIDQTVVTFQLLHLKTVFVSSFFVLGRVLRHFCNVCLYIPVALKQNIAEMSQDASQGKKIRYKTSPLISSWLIWAKIQCTFHIGLPKRVINKFEPVQQSRQQLALRAYYTKDGFKGNDSLIS